MMNGENDPYDEDVYNNHDNGKDYQICHYQLNIKEEVKILLVKILVGGFRDLRVTVLFLIHHNEGSPKA